jgi:hypothetical protein
MVWRSNTFRSTKPRGGSEAPKIVEKHKAAIKEVVDEARDLAKDSKKKIEGIRDPKLRGSAAS